VSEAARTCVVCRSKIEASAAVRIVLDPAGSPAIDWRGRLPGRGASCCYSRECLQGLSKRGVLSRAFKGDVQVRSEVWPMDEIQDRTSRRQRELVGLASKSGELKSGGNVVQRLLSKGWPYYLVQSIDAGASVSAQWEERASRRDLVMFRSLLSSEELGGALGKSGPRSVLAVRHGPLARSLRQELKRGQAFI
jgi:predicted RNA-binding protein YlxR (DUF448 family)